MAKDSALSKVEAPGTRVTVSLPALMISLDSGELTLKNWKGSSYGSTSSSVGYAPIPKIPFSDWIQTLVSGSKKEGARVGIPIVRQQA